MKSDGTGWRKTISLLALLAGSFSTTLSLSMVRIASPEIQTVFQVGYSNLTWVFNSYQIAYAVLLPVWGQLGDRYGRRLMLTLGMAVFGAGSLFCGFSWNFWSLVAFRGIQALGASAVFPNAVVIATDLFSPDKRGRIVGIWGTSVSLGTVTGPSLGGLIVQFLGWKSIFLLNIIPVAAALAVILLFAAPDEPAEGSQKPFDYPGLLVLAAAVTTLIAALVGLDESGPMDARIIVLFAIFAVSVPLLLRLESTRIHPLIDLSLFRDKIFLAGTLCGGVHLMAIQGTNFLMPLFLAGVRGLSPLQIGLVMLPQSAIRLGASPLAGVLADRFGNRLPTAVGLCLRVVTMLSLSFLPGEGGNARIAFLLLIDGLGASLIWAPVMKAVLESSPQEKAGSITGVFNMLRFVLGMFGTALSGLILDGFYRGATAYQGWVPGFHQAYLILAGSAALGLVGVKNLGRTTSRANPGRGFSQSR